jgi:hypothetical protein
MQRDGTIPQLTMLSAGDLLDRAVRLYRRDWRALLLVVLWPTLLTYAGVIAFTVGVRNFSVSRGDWRIILNVLLVGGGVGLYFCGKAALFFVLGAAARGIHDRLVDGKPFSALMVYRQVFRRFWPLVGATVCVVVLLFAAFVTLYMTASLTIAIYVLTATYALVSLPTWLQVTIHSVVGFAAALALLWLFLLVYERAVYVPQILLAEGRGVFSALGRSFTLAGRDVRRVAALLLFDQIVSWAVFFLLVAPLAWYGALHGIEVSGFLGEQPLWYNVASETLSQASEILTAPVWLAGCALLYLDRRVRREGLDLEALANRRLPLAASATPAPATFPATPPPGERGFEDSGLTVISLR